MSFLEKGFEAGVKSVDPSIKIDVQYAESFGDAAKGKQSPLHGIQQVLISPQVAGGTGAGVFNEAKSINETRNESEKSLGYWCGP